MNVEGFRVIDSSQIYKPKKTRYFTPVRISTNESKKLPTLNRKVTPLEELIKSLDKQNRFPSPERFRLKEILGITTTKNRLLLINSINPDNQRDRSCESPCKKSEDSHQLFRARKRTKGHKSVPVSSIFGDIRHKGSPKQPKLEAFKPQFPAFNRSTIKIKRFTPLDKQEKRPSQISKRRLKTENNEIYLDREEYISARYSRKDHTNGDPSSKPAQNLNDTCNWEVDKELLTGW
jgi:hypothetical protein